MTNMFSFCGLICGKIATATAALGTPPVFHFRLCVHFVLCLCSKVVVFTLTCVVERATCPQGTVAHRRMHAKEL